MATVDRSLLRRVKNYLRRKTAKPEVYNDAHDHEFLEQLEIESKVAASALELHDIKDIFGLTKDNRQIFDIPEEELIPAPKKLEDELQAIQDILGQDPTNEAACRLRLDAIIKDCILSERALLGNQKSDAPKNQLCLTLESHLELQVTYKGEDTLLSGNTDHSVWYDDKAMGTSLVIVDAKARGESDGGIAQCLAYMGMVHEIRKRNFKTNAIVYGAISDGFEFKFLRIDNQLQYAQWNAVDDWNDRTKSRIYTLLRLIIRNAASTCPRTSPTKVRHVEDSVLASDPVRYHIRFGSSADDESMWYSSV